MDDNRGFCASRRSGRWVGLYFSSEAPTRVHAGDSYRHAISCALGSSSRASAAGGRQAWSALRGRTGVFPSPARQFYRYRPVSYLCRSRSYRPPPPFRLVLRLLCPCVCLSVSCAKVSGGYLAIPHREGWRRSRSTSKTATLIRRVRSVVIPTAPPERDRNKKKETLKFVLRARGFVRWLFWYRLT